MEFKESLDRRLKYLPVIITNQVQIPTYYAKKDVNKLQAAYSTHVNGILIGQVQIVFIIMLDYKLMLPTVINLLNIAHMKHLLLLLVLFKAIVDMFLFQVGLQLQ